MTSDATTRSCVFYTPPASRPSLLSSRYGDDDVYPVFYVESVCSSFLYNIPSFTVISVGLRQVKGRDADGKETQYDLVIRNDESLPPE